MAYDQELATRIRSSFQLFPKNILSNISEKNMFGGLSFLYHGKMTVGIVKNELAVRVLSKKMDDTLLLDEVRPMDFTKRP